MQKTENSCKLQLALNLKYAYSGEIELKFNKSNYFSSIDTMAVRELSNKK
jgi:hypothetical protein